MVETALLLESDELASTLAQVLEAPRFDSSERGKVSHLSCSMSLEHWHATRLLLAQTLLPSALVVHRAQYEALVRGVWAFYAASDLQVQKLAAILSVESEQGAKNLPLVADMMVSIAAKAPQPAAMLTRFKDASWTVLNSYAHAGIHPLQRHGTGYPLQLIEQVLKNANGIALVAAVQAAILTGREPLVREVFSWQHTYANCLPSPTDA